MQLKKYINLFKITQLKLLVLFVNKILEYFLTEIFDIVLTGRSLYVLHCKLFSVLDSPVEENIIRDILFIDLVTTNQPRALVK